MTEKNLTEAEIMKALECCKKRECCDCPRVGKFENVFLCYADLTHYSLNLINRKNAEIERLTVTMNAFGLGMKRESERADSARAEAIKEFAERVKEEMKPTLFALFVIGEILVAVSKSHISSEKAFDDMREVLSRKGVIPSRFRFEKFLDQIAKEMGVEL